ncbi:MAG TPA: alpha-L-rhamnosidase C-terminal domain-containing protein, partial [Verrucomicrobiae bacterium]|nr:alpha-L-rhamnosidase C-terminal domain-containing protein [Verrucomicrobiae bacterium]
STHRALLELSRSGHEDIAWQLVTNRTFPSWLYMIDNGATTIWERWDGFVKGRGFQDPGMNSFNHWAFGAVGEWVWRNVAGLNPDDTEPGWKRFTIRPRPGGGVTWARSRHETLHGRVYTSWKLEGNRFLLDVSVPANTTATIVLPQPWTSAVTESGRPVQGEPYIKPLPQDPSGASYHVESGTYRFESTD